MCFVFCSLAFHVEKSDEWSLQTMKVYPFESSPLQVSLPVFTLSPICSWDIVIDFPFSRVTLAVPGKHLQHFRLTVSCWQTPNLQPHGLQTCTPVASINPSWHWQSQGQQWDTTPWPELHWQRQPWIQVQHDSLVCTPALRSHVQLPHPGFILQ